MGRREERNAEIQQYVIENLRAHGQDIAALVAGRFGISRQAAARHLQRLRDEGLVFVSGKTRSSQYELLPVKNLTFTYEIGEKTQEDRVWRQDVMPALAGLRDNVVTICQYGLTEMLNNALEHSEGEQVTVRVELWPDLVQMGVLDDGVGIFEKIQRDLHLDDPLHALLELSKGKLSTDPQHHTGEGIFFTSRAFDAFTITSHQVYFVHRETGLDFVFEKKDVCDGTDVQMEIRRSSERTLKSAFDSYSVDGSFGFDRTVAPVFLAQYGNEKLVSRSQARRLLARLDRFKVVLLDFDKVDYIGQAFADEIFRVFQQEHPEVQLLWANESDEVRGMIARARGGLAAADVPIIR